MPPTVDRSTLNGQYIRTHWRPYRLPPTYCLQNGSGNGCSGDAPGFPTYFTRSVYTQHGNYPHNAPRLVIEVDGSLFAVPKVKDPEPYSSAAYWQAWHDVYRPAWNPPPLDSERGRAWVAQTAKHCADCYRDEQRISTRDGATDDMVIFPVPYYELRQFTDDPRFSQEWRDKEQAAVKAYNDDLIARRASVATFENRTAWRAVLQFYPDAKPEGWLRDMILHPPERHAGNWYERYATRPTPEECPGQYGHPHPVNDTWCQLCGWHNEL
jgi:hypothetical protein